jgi:hypothetical protein
LLSAYACAATAQLIFNIVPRRNSFQPPPSRVAICFASWPKNAWLLAVSRISLLYLSRVVVPNYDSPLLAPQAPLFAPPGASCTLYVAYPACASLAKKTLTSAALKPVSAFARVAELGVALSGVDGRPLLGSRLWLARCAQKFPGGWAGLF